MVRLFLECAIRAALIVIGTAIVLYALRVKVAAVRHRVWTGVLAVMLLLPLWTAFGPKLPLHWLPPVAQKFASAILATPSAPGAIAVPSTGNTPAVAQATRPALPLAEVILLGIYLFGVFVLLLRLAIGTWKAQRLVRAATLQDGQHTSSSCAAPVTVGCIHPTVILPPGWQDWPAPQLAAVLAHENEHVRRRDPLVQWLSLLNRSVFWFHPAAWWLERELSALAEESCDAAVIAQGHDPRDYADVLMNMARAVARSGSRINSVQLAMPGARLPQRIRQIVAATPAARMSRTRLASLTAVCIGLSVAAASGTLARQSANPSAVGAANSQRPHFEVASVKSCEAGDVGYGGRGGGGGGSPPPQWSPGRLSITCQPVKLFIDWAYIGYADAATHANRSEMAADVSSLNTTIEGLPSWGNSERFTISAEVPGDASKDMMMGPMMQSLLEDRFHLKIRVETREVPAYDLRVAKGGPKLPEPQDAFCRTVDPKDHAQRLGPANLPDCTMQLRGITMADLATIVRGPLGVDRPVIDKTSLTGAFEIHMVWAPDRSAFPAGADLPEDAPGTPTIFEAFKDELGLELVPSKGPDKTLVIDHIEEPTPN